MGKYRKEFIIPYYDTDKYGFVQPKSLLTYLGETSSFHSDSVGLGITNLRKNDYGWMLNRWKVRIDKYPRVKERVIIETWPLSFDKFYASREFIIYDEDNNELGRASSLWVFLDIIRKRPIRIPREFNEKYGLINEKLFPDFYDFSTEFITKSHMDFNVRKSDIDYNNHVNNVEYLNWILEAIPVDIDENYRLYEFDIQYKKEIKLGSLIKSSLIESVGEDKLTYLHKITEGDEINAYGKTVWKK